MDQPQQISGFSKNEYVFIGSVTGYTFYPNKVVDKPSRRAKPGDIQFIPLEKAGVIVQELSHVFLPNNSVTQFEIADDLSPRGYLGNSFLEMKKIFPIGSNVLVVGYETENDQQKNGTMSLRIDNVVGVFYPYKARQDGFDPSVNNLFDLSSGDHRRNLFEIRKEFLRLEQEKMENGRYKILTRLTDSTPKDVPIDFFTLFSTYVSNRLCQEIYTFGN